MNNATQKNSSITRLIGLGLVVLVGLVTVAAYQNGWLIGSRVAEGSSSTVDLSKVKTVLPVNSQRVRFVNSIEQTRHYTGVVRARRSSELAFETVGKIKEVLVREGQQVEAGQVIATMDIATLQAQQAATMAQLAQSKFLMNELEAGPREEQIAAASADADAASSEYANAKLRATRRQELLKKNAISTEEYDQAKLGVRTAKARWQAAAERLAELTAGTRQEQLSGQQANVTQLEAAGKEIEVAISKSNLLAPFSGTITKRYLDPGNIVQPSTPVCRLVEQSRLEARIGLPVKVATQIQVGQQYIVQVAGDSYEVTALTKIQELDNLTTQLGLKQFYLSSPPAVLNRSCRGNYAESKSQRKLKPQGAGCRTRQLPVAFAVCHP